jgi:NTE family protein
MASLFSPYDFNPLGFDPLSGVLDKWIDFDAIRTSEDMELLIGATEVLTGRARLFRREAISAQVVAASSCLPALHHAVEIDGIAYWDGGFSCNPDIVTLAQESPVRDTLIVQIAPLRIDEVPTGAHSISNHVYNLSFQASLVRDAAIVETAKACKPARRYALDAQSRGLRRLATHNFHLVDASPLTSKMCWTSKVHPDWDVFVQLFETGRKDAETWLKVHGKAVGRRSSVDLGRHFLMKELGKPSQKRGRARPARAGAKTAGGRESTGEGSAQAQGRSRGGSRSDTQAQRDASDADGERPDKPIARAS